MLMEETTDTAAIELEANLHEEQQQSDSMDGPSLSQNQETSNSTEEIIDNDDGDETLKTAPPPAMEVRAKLPMVGPSVCYEGPRVIEPEKNTS